MAIRHSHLFSILHRDRVSKSPISAETTQILLLVWTTKAKTRNILLSRSIDRLLSRFWQLSNCETSVLIISGKLGGVSQGSVKTPPVRNAEKKSLPTTLLAIIRGTTLLQLKRSLATCVTKFSTKSSDWINTQGRGTMITQISSQMKTCALNVERLLLVVKDCENTRQWYM